MITLLYACSVGYFVIFDQSSRRDVSDVTSMERMFDGCDVKSDLSEWNISDGTNTFYMYGVAGWVLTKQKESMYSVV